MSKSQGMYKLSVRVHEVTKNETGKRENQTRSRFQHFFARALIRQADTTVKTKQNETKQRETADSSRGIEQIHHR